MQYAYKSVIESLSEYWQLHWMSELESYGKLGNINNLLYCKYSTNMQYTYKSGIDSLNYNLSTFANRTTEHTVFLNCGVCFQSEIVVVMSTKN